MRREIKTDSAEFELFTTLFELEKAYGTPEDNERYWKEVLHAVSYHLGEAEKFENIRFMARKFAKAWLEIMEHRYKTGGDLDE